MRKLGTRSSDSTFVDIYQVSSFNMSDRDDQDRGFTVLLKSYDDYQAFRSALYAKAIRHSFADHFGRDEGAVPDQPVPGAAPDA